MPGDLRIKYPGASSIALALTLASLASDSTLLAGRASTAVDNTGNNDTDALLSGLITTGTSPTGGAIEVWAWASRKNVTVTPTYPDSITGTDAAKTMTSANVKFSALRLVTSISVDTTSNRGYDFAPASIAALFGNLPPFWGIFVTHSSGVALNATAGNHEMHYQRIQGQYT